MTNETPAFKRQNSLKKEEKRVYQKFLKWFWGIFVGFLLLVFIFFCGIAYEWFGDMPTFEELENPKSYLASEVYSCDGELLGKYYFENRSTVYYSEISPYLVEALVATEDARFYDHSGVDMKATFRVAFGVLSGQSKGGGSTITQQLAKNLFPRGRINKAQLVLRKFKEWVTAIKLEHNYSKDEIIAMYFNTIDFGSQAFGIKSAAMTFFGKLPIELNMEEAALCVAVVNAPTRYSPVRNPENALARRNLVLSQMEKYDYITPEECDSVQQIPIDMSRFKLQDHQGGLAPYFREYLRQFLKEWCQNTMKPDGTPYDLYKDGLKIYTTIDSRMQRYAEEAVTEHLGKDLQPAFYKHWKGHDNAPFSDLSDEEIEKIYQTTMKRCDRYRDLKSSGADQEEIQKIFDTPVEMTLFSWNGLIDTVLSPMDSIKYYMWFLQSGLMSIEPNTGYVKAYVGGPDFRFFKYDHVKSGARQVGSTFKPFVYALAIQEKGYTPCTEVPNIQPTIELPDGNVWEPANSSKECQGEMVTLKWALANSINWVSAYLINEVSPQAVIQLARKMGVKSEIPPVPAICLGVADIKLSEMVGAFNTYPSKGIYVEPIFITHIEDKYGNVLEAFYPKRTEALSEETAYTMLRTMQGVVEAGTSIRLRYKYQLTNPIAGKTGTTQNHSDGWFMGITPQLTTGVWTGCDVRSIHFRNIKEGQGSNMALPIFGLYMQKIYADSTLNFPKDDFEKPTSGYDVEFDCSKVKKRVQDF
ncbi:MAG: transglycosylase domain-containing protein [Bacteroidales bacterium]|nr:transglycosylase domain-containing protein [Bacteroidales bacterium]